jgi:hypothetical protein
VEPLLELPETPHNAALLDYLKGQATPPDGPGDYTLGSWQLHKHPDLMALLRQLAPGWPLTAAYGVPLLASEGIAALGTDWLAVRIDHLPPDTETEDSDHPEWTFIHGDWHVIPIWQSNLSELATAALAHAASLAAK